MTVDEIRDVLVSAATLRMPNIDKDIGLSGQVEQMQDHLVATAVVRSDLEQARLYAHMAAHELRIQWGEISQAEWGEHLPTERTARLTNAMIEMAKAVVRPELHSGLREAKFLIDRLSEQIRRLENDDAAASRVYTMLTGS